MRQEFSEQFIEEISKRRPTNPDTPINAKILNFSDGSSGVVLGLSKREYFAAMAMQGLLSTVPEEFNGREIAEMSVSMCDALIEALNK